MSGSILTPAAAAPRSTGFYAPELDSLRCLAVGTVMIAHFSPALSKYADWGSIGVRLFFVLSGFLITLILLRMRDQLSDETSRVPALRQFFIRRIFRLWPLYFASLLAAYALMVPGTESSIAWHLTFTTNHYVFWYQSWPGLLSHFWTLAVEQQFYVVWPFLLLLLPKRQLPALLIVVLISGPLSRGLLALRAGANPTFDYVLLPCCLDFFALGGAIAWWQRAGKLQHLVSTGGLRAILFATAIWILLGAVLKTYEVRPPAWSVYDPLFQATGFAALITYLLRQQDSVATRALRWPVLVYLGQISYGIYVFHNFMHRVGPSLLRRVTGFSYFSNEAAHVIYLSCLSVVVAAISYHWFEEPLRKLGRRFA